jgi:hypothetical protein
MVTTLSALGGVLRLSAVAIIMTWASAEPVHAQFETPNRQFHNQTGFPLEGRHLTIACESCHINGVYKGTPSRCFDCHWARRRDDRYRLQLGSECAQCHRPAAWTAVQWDHGAMTPMPLNASHRQLSCQSCHGGDTFRQANVTCVSCHLPDYQAARTPNHPAAGFPTTCEACHRPDHASFQQARFDHNASFPLVGVHGQQTCATCHRGNAYKGTPRDCVGCHRAAYERTTAPNHTAAGFSTACETCHRSTDSSFRGATFNHGAVFPLVGQHARQACATCHVNNVFNGTPRDCVGCHRSAYERTTAPNHPAAGFPTACETCHRSTDASWRGAGFNHSTVFALVGRHAQTVCATCHANNVYRGTPRDCVGCHRADYERTSAPNHAAASFPTACETCHRPDSSWRGAVLNHAAVFQLVGRHGQIACASCHSNNLYRGTPRTCVGCHRASYDRTSSPNHAAAGFPTTCDSCHRATDASWQQGTFNHRFPTTSGPHRQPCATCHQSSSFQTFTCLVCHQHDRQRMDDKHKERNGYRYDSAACYSCHPTGRG